jgi:type III secretory pathway lipoprotein EscJ
MHRRADVFALLAIIVVAALLGALCSHLARTRMVPLYAADLTDRQANETCRFLNESHFRYDVRSRGRIYVPAEERARVIQALQQVGLPHRPLAVRPPPSPLASPRNERNRDYETTGELEADLTDQLRQFHCLIDAEVYIEPNMNVVRDASHLTVRARLWPRQGSLLPQDIEAVTNLLRYSTNFHSEPSLTIVDSSGRVWTIADKAHKK